MIDLFKHIKYNENYSILEFGSGDEPFVSYGEHSWKIVQILSIKK